MQSINVSRLCFWRKFHFEDTLLEQKFDSYRNPYRFKQISYISGLTACLYLLFSLISYFFAPLEIASLMWGVHVFILAPFLFFLSYLAKDLKHVKTVNLLLFLAPIGASVFNVYVREQFFWTESYTTELYLMIFWIFTVSGLRLGEASLCALMVFFITIASSYYLPLEFFILHAFWSFASLSFGFMGAYLLEYSYRNIFLKEQALERMAQTDALTGLYNRAYFDIALAKELSRMKRSKHNFACIFVDIDYFKKINDDYGHKIGDEVLVEVSELILRCIRQNDIVVRWGGEEFIIISIDIEEEGTLAVSQNLRQKIENFQFSHINTLSVSVGCTLSKIDDTEDSIVKRADKALYAAKKKGRNCVIYLKD